MWWFSYVQLQIHPVIHLWLKHQQSKSPCKVHQSPVLSSRPSTSAQLTSPQAGGLPWTFRGIQHRLSSSALPDASSVSEKDCISSVQCLISLEAVHSSQQHPQTATSVLGQCGHGPFLCLPGGHLPPHSCNPPFQCIQT